MKFEDYLLQPGDDKRKRLDLQEEVKELKIIYIYQKNDKLHCLQLNDVHLSWMQVEKLEAELEEEQATNKALHSVLHGPVSSYPCLAPFLPPQAALNVGGIVLNALAIEHFILRHPREANHGHVFYYYHKGPAEEKEMLLRHAYGLGYPEPNVTFALCRGSRSSPALRVYTPDEVVNELEQAKVEYLEASVGITSKRKLVVPKLLQWNMRDFADDMGSLLEWIYSQLPHSGSLKRLMMECLNVETNSTSRKIVEIQPYQSEFRYLLPL